MFDLKTNSKRKYRSHSCPFCRVEPETLGYLFKCTDGLHCPQDVALQHFTNTNDIDNLKQIGFFHLKYQKFRDVYEGSLFYCCGL